MTYTTNEAAKKLGISKDTLLYYEKEGLLPVIKRDTQNRRIYSETDIDWIFLIRCLRDTDMPIRKIKEYMSLLKDNYETSMQERKNILLEHEAFINEKIKTYQNLQTLIHKKISYYNDIMNSTNPKAIRCTDYAAEWEHFRNILEEL